MYQEVNEKLTYAGKNPIELQNSKAHVELYAFVVPDNLLILEFAVREGKCQRTELVQEELYK